MRCYGRYGDAGGGVGELASLDGVRWIVCKHRCSVQGASLELLPVHYSSVTDLRWSRQQTSEFQVNMICYILRDTPFYGPRRDSLLHLYWFLVSCFEHRSRCIFAQVYILPVAFEIFNLKIEIF